MRFEKISVDEAIRLHFKTFGWSPSKEKMAEILENLPLPSRKTAKSAGYDFHSPVAAVVKEGATIKIPLFVKVVGMPSRAVLLIFNRSSLSLKDGLSLDNCVAIIDADFDQCILFQATAHKGQVIIDPYDRICQGVFMNFLTVDGDNVTEKRTGGIGSTGR